MYSPGPGQITPRGQNLNVNRNILSLRSFVTSLKKIPLKSSDFIYILMILYMYIAPRQGQTNPWGQNFYVNRNILSLTTLPICHMFQKISLKSDFIHIFNEFIQYI